MDKPIIIKPIQNSDEFKIFEEARDVAENHGPIASIFLGKMPFGAIATILGEKGNISVEAAEWLLNFKKFLIEKVDPEENERTGKIPEAVVEELQKMGAFALKIPKKYGGLGFTYNEYHLVFVMVASYCTNLAVMMSATNSIGVSGPLLEWGTDEQKDRWGPILAKGKPTGFAMTEKESGSDQSLIETLASRVYKDGKHIGYVLNGEKLYTTNAVGPDGKPFADYLLVIAKIYIKDEYAIEHPKYFSTKTKTIALIVKTKSPGFSVVGNDRSSFEALRAIYNGPTKFTDVFVPIEDRLGNERSGLKIGLKALEYGRLSLTSCCTSTDKQMLQFSRWWGLTRIQGGNPIGVYELKAEKIVRTATVVMVMNALTGYCANVADNHGDLRIEGAVGKAFGTKMLWEIMCYAMRERGGRSVETYDSQKRRGEYPALNLTRHFLAAWLSTIYEGENDVMTLWIGSEGLHPYKKLATILKIVASHISQVQKTSYTGPHAKYLSFIEDETARAKDGIETALLHHKIGMYQKQIISEEIVNRVVHLFFMALILSYADIHQDKPMAFDLAHHYCDEKIEEMTGLRARFEHGWIKHGSHNSVIELSKRIMEGQAVWLEEGIISLLEKEGVKI